MQYLVGIGVFFFIGGLNAMLIRAELLRPSPQLFGAGNYLTIVGLHGAMMMGVMSSGDPRAVRQLLRPADDRRAADGLPADRGAHLLAADGGRGDLHLDDLLRRLPDRLDGLRAAQRPGELRLRLLHLLLRPGRSLDDPARAQPDRHDRDHARAGADLEPPADLLLGRADAPRADGARGAGPDRGAADGRLRPQRCRPRSSSPAPAAAPTYSRTSSGSSATRRSTCSRCPGFGIILELLPVFARKPLWGYRLAVAGMLGVALLSFFVWQHHLFVSGINSALRPFYMLSTEVISIPTGFIFLCGMATLWRARIRYTVPMLFCLAWFFNFFIGGVSGVFLSDTPSDVSHPRQLLRHGPLPLHDHGRPDLHLLRRRSTTGCRR